MIPQAAVSVRRFLILGIAAIAAAVTGVAAQAGDPTDDATAGATVTISPSVIVLDNPIARGGHSRRQQIKLSVTVTDRHGRAVLPSRRRPILLDIYQPRGGPLRPGAARITSAEDPSAVFTYDGGYFANSMILTATMGDAGASTSIVPRNRFDPDDCPPGAGHVALRYRDPMRTLEHGFKIDVSVGGGRWHTGVELDTGSTGLVLDRRSIGPEAIGPGKPGTREYYPSGYKIVGNYWLTPVTIGISDPDWGPKAVARTVPIEVFGIDRVECGSNVKTCVPPADQQKAIAGFSLMGIGFDRGGAPSSNNPFLQLEDVVYGRMRPGYVISPDRVDIGLDAANTAEKFDYTPLAPSDDPPGGWSGANGCFSFPAAAAKLCGSMLLDTGIDQMIFALAKDKRPPAVVDPLHPELLKPGTAVDISAPTAPPLALSYGFTYEPRKTSSAVEPKSIRWAAPPATKPPVFFNIGRTPLARFDYLYDDRCGRVGFFDRLTTQ
ncbi:MAG: hypothetical protein WA417_20100 [Stellaceae bacterium]